MSGKLGHYFFISPESKDVIDAIAQKLNTTESEALEEILKQFVLRVLDEPNSPSQDVEASRGLDEVLYRLEALAEKGEKAVEESKVNTLLADTERQIGITNGLLDDLATKMKRISL